VPSHDVVVDLTGSPSTLRLADLQSRILAGWAWARLDREIASGLPIEESGARVLHARELLRPEQRRAIAAVLRNILDVAEASRISDGAGSADGPRAVVASRDRIVQLIELLRGGVPMSAAAVARAELLACDRHSPLVCPHGADAIVQALDQIAVATVS
jgi:hypothetical protein